MLLGARAPAREKNISKCEKKIPNKNLAHTFEIICVHVKFRRKPTFFMACVKKMKKYKMNSCNEASEIVFFTQATKNLGFHWKLCART